MGIVGQIYETISGSLPVALPRRQAAPRAGSLATSLFYCAGPWKPAILPAGVVDGALVVPHCSAVRSSHHDATDYAPISFRIRCPIAKVVVAEGICKL